MFNAVVEAAALNNLTSDVSCVRVSRQGRSGCFAPISGNKNYQGGIHKQTPLWKGSHVCDQVVNPIQLCRKKAYIMVFVLELDGF